MYKKIALIATVIFISISSCALGQDCWNEFGDSLNLKIVPMHDGKYHAIFNFADKMLPNTIFFEGTCYFSKDSASYGSVADFIMFEHDTIPIFAYMGQRFYKFDASKKQYTNQFLRRSNFYAKSTFDFQHFLAVSYVLNNSKYPFDDFLMERGDSSFCDCKYAGNMKNEVFRSQQYGEQTVKKYHVIKRGDNTKTIEISDVIAYPDRTQTRLWLLDSMRPIANGGEFVRKKISEITQAYTKVESKDLDDPNWVEPPPPPKPGEKIVMDSVPLTALKKLDGTPFSLNQVGGKLILIDFWFANCQPCLKAMPEIENISKTYASKGLKVVGIDPFDFDMDIIKTALQKNGATYPAYSDPEAGLATALGVSIFPTLLLVDSKSKMIYFTQVGSSDLSDVKKAIDEHLTSK